MQRAQLVGRAAEPMLEIVRNLTPEHADAATPCEAYRVRQLANHLLFWAPSLTAAARKEGLAPPAASDVEVDLATGDWHASLDADVRRLAAAWSDPAAWEGDTHFAGPDPAPAALIGGMVATELVLHGWDLARATGQRPNWDDDLLDFVHAELDQTAEQGRKLGAYGPEMAVPRTASTLDRALGLSGRDPAWAAP